MTHMKYDIKSTIITFNIITHISVDGDIINIFTQNLLQWNEIFTYICTYIHYIIRGITKVWCTYLL